ncbi:hypothetical protein GCM10017600_03630 [Streptosporangium carneum]|uniref:Tyr recombinase domain-containing protein n=1 Tax=Streptosporangium carneum TaxID=47481 RepID=A0A9W6MAU0_9ACTN|nr:hypothetical protein GCM10017600_03630 [Streptosporangium carneum]
MCVGEPVTLLGGQVEIIEIGLVLVAVHGNSSVSPSCARSPRVRTSLEVVDARPGGVGAKGAEGATLHARVVVSLLIGARTEELRALTWSHVDLDGQPDADPPVLSSIMVRRSVRVGGDTKTEKSRRTLALSRLCVDALRGHRERQALARIEGRGSVAGERPRLRRQAGDRVDAANVRRAFRVILKRTESCICSPRWT